jgi:CO/xanthine dehydrogenase Mo-binding subunit
VAPRLLAACARNLKRPVKLVVSRSMTFQSTGHHPVTNQRIQLAADETGRLTAIQHDYVNHTNMQDDYDEGCGEATVYVPGSRLASNPKRRDSQTRQGTGGQRPRKVSGYFR